MKKIFYIVLFIQLGAFVLSQDRSTIFDTGDENPQQGSYPIVYTDENNIQAAADRFYVSHEYTLERFYVYIAFEPESNLDFQQIEVEICENENSAPGTPIATKTITLQPSQEEGMWYAASLINDCIKTNSSSYYWLVVKPLEGTTASWAYSEYPTHYYSTTEDDGQTWEDPIFGYAGSAIVQGEQIYIPPYDGGDVNGDFIVNILDVVAMIQFILGNIEFNDEQIEAGDMNQDGGINILDVVAIVNQIIDVPDPSQEFMYEDINVNSDTFGQEVGPPVYQGELSCYYFGKAG